MKRAYTIISIDESRQDLASKLRQGLSILEITDIEFVDGRNSELIEETIRKYGCEVRGKFHYGELGVWFSQVNCWRWLAESDYDSLIVFEDDAIVVPNFESKLEFFIDDLPDDYDFFSLSVPDDQHADYYYHRRFLDDGGWELVSHVKHKFDQSIHYIGSNIVATAYQGYSCVATMYSKKGAEKLLEIFKTKGIYTPVDCFLFLERNMGNLDGYAPTPTAPKLASFVEKGTLARSTGMYS